MATSVEPVPVSEATAAPTSETPAVVETPVVEQPKPTSIKEAAERAREMVEKDRQAREGTAPVAGDVTEPVPVEGEETPEQAAEREAKETADKALLTVEIPGREAEETFAIEVGDLETAERIRQLTNAAVRGDQARAIREEAQTLRDQADEIQMGVQLDPAGFIAQVMSKPQDVDFLVRHLLTRPGVLDRAGAWIQGLLAEPEAIPNDAILVDAEGIKRKEQVTGQVQEERAVRDNARQLIRTMHKSMDSLLPDGFTDEGKQLFANDIQGDIRAYNRWQVAQDPHNTRVDPRVVPGLIQRRMAMMGLAPRSANAPAAALPAATVPHPPVAAPVKTAAEIKKVREARRAAGSAPVGAGSPVAGLTKPPQYDPTKKGSPIQQAAAHARDFVKSLSKRPQ